MFRNILVTIICAAFSLASIGRAAAGTGVELIAYSLSWAAEAAKPARNHLDSDATLGMTDVIGFLLGDEGDPVLIGKHREGGTDLGPDGVAQLLRSAAAGGLTGPGVSLEPVPGDTNWLEAVYFGEAGTSFAGAVSFAGDLLFKQIALGTKPSNVPGLLSYADRLVTVMQGQGANQWDVLSRFWFAPAHMPIASSSNAWVLGKAKVAVLVENLRASVNGVSQTNFVDTAAELFAAEAMQRFGELTAQHREFADIEAMMGSLQVAAVMVQNVTTNHLAYWLRDYNATPVDCPRGSQYLRRQVRVPGAELTMFGGVRSAGLAIRLAHHELPALRQAVLAARPADRSRIAWKLRLDEDMLRPTNQLRAAKSFVQGAQHREARRFREAALAFDSAAKAAPEAVEARFLAAVCRRESSIASASVGRLPASVEEFRRLARECPGFPEIRFELAVTLTTVGDNREASRIFDRILSEAPKNVAAHYALALCSFRLGDRRGAEEHARQCIDLGRTGPIPRSARRLLQDLQSAPSVGTARTFECGRFTCQYPASWRVLTGEEAAILLRDANLSSTIEVGFVSPINPDCNVVITSKAIPVRTVSAAQLEVALQKPEQMLRTKNSGYRNLSRQSIPKNSGGILKLSFVTERLGRSFRQDVATHFQDGLAVTVTCSAPESEWTTAMGDAFAMAGEIEVAPLQAE